MEDYPKSTTKQCTQTILNQMNLNFMYKINEKEGKFSLGFFCHIKNKNKKIPIIVINNHIFDEENKDIINVSLNDKVKEIKLGNTKYRNKEFNISMVEIKEDEEYNFNFLELDDELYRDDVELYYYKESIYIINYNKNNSVFVSYGLIKNLNKSELIISGNIKSNLNGYPIFNVTNNKIIGIFNSNNKYFNKGIFFNYLII